MLYSRVRLREVRCGAVDARAREVPIVYEGHARRLDEHTVAPHLRVAASAVRAGTAPPGPVLSALREFPPCGGRVWGAYTEASAPVHHLIDFLATTGAADGWRRMGARDEAQARGFLVQAIRRSLGVTAWLCQARLVRWRLSTVGVRRLPARARRLGAPTGPAADQLRIGAAELARIFLDGLRPVVRPPGALPA